MIPLRGRASKVDLAGPLERGVWRLDTERTTTALRHARAYLIKRPEERPPKGYGLYVAKSDASDAAPAGRSLTLPAALDHLQPSDILGVSDDGKRLNVLWRQRSRQNSILLTERCDHYCLMCSQPPKTRNDDWLLEQAFELIRLLPESTSEIGFTGGEPTLYGEQLLELLRLCRTLQPRASVHLLSNGRRFADDDFATAYAAVGNPNQMVGIPLYGAEPALHDYVVQARGAFTGTVRGILNLVALGQRVEIRVVVHRQTAPHLVEIAEFVQRNLPFVEQVVWMGLEMIGLARANMEEVWIDPYEYRHELAEAVSLLDRGGLRTLVYNHQLCLLEERTWPFAVRSISDWKNEYHQECMRCSVMHDCGGFFFSAKNRMSAHIRAIPAEVSGTEPSLLELSH